MRWVWMLLAVLGGCILIHGPCSLKKDAIVCEEGGQATVFKPDSTIKEIQDDNEDDPRIVVPPRQRN